VKVASTIDIVRAEINKDSVSKNVMKYSSSEVKNFIKELLKNVAKMMLVG